MVCYDRVDNNDSIDDIDNNDDNNGVDNDDVDGVYDKVVFYKIKDIINN